MNSDRWPLLTFSKKQLDNIKDKRLRSYGTQRWVTWDEFCERCSVPMYADSKDGRGGFTPGLFDGGWRKTEASQGGWAMVIDLDDRADTDEVASWLSAYDGLVYDTYRSRPENLRCRVVLRLSRTVDVDDYKAVHREIQKDCVVRGYDVDPNASDLTRLSYLPVRPHGADYRCRILTGGKLLDVDEIIDSIPPPIPPSGVRIITPERAGAYLQAALRAAGQNVCSASEGARHGTLYNEARSLSRHDELSEQDIYDALYGPAVAAMGKSRASEASATIRDAIRQRRGA